jgi:hypothetical protein
VVESMTSWRVPLSEPTVPGIGRVRFAAVPVLASSIVPSFSDSAPDEA